VRPGLVAPRDRAPNIGRQRAQATAACGRRRTAHLSSDHSGRRARIASTFIELDRGTERPAEQLAAKIARYTRLRYYTPTSADSPAEPLWRRYYRSWPHLLIVLADQSERRMRQRIQRTLALYESAPGTDHRIAIPVSFVGLDDLLTSGPFAHICVNADQPDRLVNWLGEASDELTKDRHDTAT